jgi:hypothetical protein
MKRVRFAVILAVMAIAAILGLQRASLAQNAAAAQAASNLRILSPHAGAQLAQDFVNVRYELVNPAVAASPTPTYQLQLDDTDPVRTASTDYTFTGLAAGKHTVTVELVDANNTPVAGTRNAVQFTVGQRRPTAGAPQGAFLGPGDDGTAVLQSRLFGAHLEVAAYDDHTAETLPNTSSALPLLSVIGFGVLLGGIASALKTR